MSFSWRYLITTFSIFISVNSYSQGVFHQIKSSEIIAKGIDLYKSEKYREAIDVYKTVPRTDTNYKYALYNISLASYNDSNYTQGKKFAEEGLKLYPETEEEWKTLIASNLEKLGKVKEALSYYDDILKYTSNTNYTTWFNKGITYFNARDFDQAKKCFQKAVLVNPYYASGHYYLGNIAYQEGNLVPAILSYTTTLLVNPEHNLSGNTIAALSSIAQVSDELAKAAEKKNEWKNDNFEEIQEILLSKIALDKQYKIKAGLEDAIVRQVQVALEKLSYNKNDNGFWMQYYAPIFEKIFKEGQFEPFIFHVFSSVDIKEVKAYNKNSKKKIENVISLITTYFNELRETQTLDLSERSGVVERYYFSNYKADGKGKLETDGKKTILSGPWEFYHENGRLKSKGILNNQQQKEGEWLFYHANGQLKETGIFKNDKAEGKSYTYFENGVVSAAGTFVNGAINGKYEEYFYNGLPLKIEHWSNGKRQGTSKTFLANGTVANECEYKDDKKEGIETHYHKNGEVSSVSNYKNGFLNGTFKVFYLDGTLSVQGAFTDDKRSGNWKVYYNNGKVKTNMTYVAGEAEGEFTEFHSNGATTVKGTYKKGSFDGNYEDFEPDGKLFSTSIFEKGKLRDMKFFNKEGKTISDFSTRNGAGNLIYYDGHGNKTSEGYFTKDGERDGKTTYYFRNGKVSAVANFKKGILDGDRTSYYTDGSISEKTFYKNDEESGFRVRYFSNGKKKEEAILNNGVYDGLVVEYDEFETVISKANYSKGDSEGYTEIFQPNGKIDSEPFYISGWISGFKNFDTLGNVLDDLTISNNSVDFVLTNYAGDKYAKGSYRNHYLHGEHRVFYPDGTTSNVQYYKYGERDSIFRKYYYGGKLQYEGYYKMSEKHGRWNYYYEDGKLNYTEEYNNGRQNGSIILYNEDGTVDKEMSYKENMLDGPYKIYGEEGHLAIVLNYADGKLMSYSYEGKNGQLVPGVIVKNGTAKVIGYYKNGKQSAELEFEEDEINGVRKVFFTSGNIYIDARRNLGLDDGLKKVYYADGKLHKEENYYYGSQHGKALKYFPNGKVMSEENWYNGQQHGISKYYDITGKLVQTRVYYFATLQSVKK